MNKTLIGVVVVVVLLGAVWLFAGTSEDTTTNTSKVQNDLGDTMNDYQTIVEEIQSGEAVLLDVRTPMEFVSGRASEATNLELQAIQTGARPNISKDTTVYVYCRSGNRSAEAAAILKNDGYAVVDLGGLGDIQKLGAELVQ